MAITSKALAVMQLASSKGDVYAPASGTKGHIHNITLHNTNSTTENVKLYRYHSSTSFLMANVDLATNETLILSFENEGAIIDGTSSVKLEGYTTTAAKVNIFVDGSEIT